MSIDPFVGAVFALVVFVSDEFVAVRPSAQASDPARFFVIASKLPMELQMVLCNRLFSSDKDIVLRKHSETAFLLLAQDMPFDNSATGKPTAATVVSLSELWI